MERHWYAYVAVAALVSSAWWVAPTWAQFGGGKPPAGAVAATEVEGALSRLLNKEAYIRVGLAIDQAMIVRGKVTAVGEGFVLVEKEGIIVDGRLKASKMLINLKDVAYIGFDLGEGN